MFCSPFDEHLAEAGPAAVFLPDPEGLLRFDAEWTRDAWSRATPPLTRGRRWVLARDRDSGYVLMVLTTSPDLLVEHPRLQLRAFTERDEATAALAALGRPPLARDPW